MIAVGELLSRKSNIVYEFWTTLPKGTPKDWAEEIIKDRINNHFVVNPGDTIKVYSWEE